MTRTFDEMAVRSDQVAAWLGRHGVGRGDPVIVMLNNQVELWETMLAVMKLGAIIMPTTTAAGATEIQDRLTSGGARHAICNAADTQKFADTAFGTALPAPRSRDSAASSAGSPSARPRAGPT